jgi:IS4 transposase
MGTAGQLRQTCRKSNLSQAYPKPLRRICYHDAERSKRLIFPTNDFLLLAATIAALYKSRWQIGSFFKSIKQHLRIKSFYGTSENAVTLQIWITVLTYLIVTILKKELRIKLSLYTTLQIPSLMQFEKTPIIEALAGKCQ